MQGGTLDRNEPTGSSVRHSLQPLHVLTVQAQPMVLNTSGDASFHHSS